MKIGLKLWVLWAASMVLFIATGVASWLTMDVMAGVRGLTIRFFLGYGGIIVVFQVFAALAAGGQMFRDLAEKPTESSRS